MFPTENIAFEVLVYRNIFYISTFQNYFNKSHPRTLDVRKFNCTCNGMYCALTLTLLSKTVIKMTSYKP